jgi:FkbM family methyltransferase
MGVVDSIFRKLPLFKGKGRIARIIFKNKMAREKDLVVVGKYGCEYILPNILENIGFDIFINGIYERQTSDYICRNVPLNGVFLDLGANIGAITIPINKRRKDIKLVCVEASPRIFSYLKQNLRKNEAIQAQLVNKALFYSDNEKLGFYSPDEKYGKGSLSPVFTDIEVSVMTVKLDTLLKELGIKKVDLIKIDVEGFEYHVFKGAESLLSGNDAPDIIFEFVDWAEKSASGIEIGAAQQILMDMGYRIFCINDRNKMNELDGIIREGSYMLFASKKGIHN